LVIGYIEVSNGLNDSRSFLCSVSEFFVICHPDCLISETV